MGLCSESLVLVLPTVLHITFPKGIQQVFNWVKPFVEWQSILQLDCITTVDFYDLWIVRVLIIPCVMVGVVCLRYAYECQCTKVAQADAVQNLRGNLFVVVFLICKRRTILFV